MLRLYLTYPPIYAIAALIALVMPLLVFIQITSPSVSPLQLSGYDTYHCVSGNEGEQTLRVLVPSSAGARELADRLCRAPQLRSVLSGVDITWQTRDFLQTAHILNQSYDIIFNRPNVINGVSPDFALFYRQLDEGETYNLYWLSREEPVNLTTEFFRTKKVGLLQDAMSRSFHQLPLTRIRQVIAEPDAIKLRYYPDLNTLYAAFSSGEVDIIPSVAEIDTYFGLNEPVRTLLAADLSSGVWLVSRTLDASFDCPLRAAIRANKLLSHEPSPGEDSSCVR